MAMVRFISKYRRILVMLAIFLVGPTLINVLVYNFHSRVRVGIVLVDDCNVTYASTVKNGFDHHEEYFDARIIRGFALNSSHIRINNSLLLTTDFFSKTRSRELCGKHDVDVILYVTDKKIHNWDDPDGGAWWGQADLETFSAVMTVHYFMNGSDDDNSRIRSIGVHEIGHLLGFTHPPAYESNDDIMTYASSSATLDFTSYYEFTLPFHLTVYRLGNGYRLGWKEGGYAFNFMFIKMLVDLFFLPYLIGATILVFCAINSFTRSGRIHRSAIAITSTAGFLMYSTIVYGFRAIMFVVTFILLLALLYHLGMAVQKNREEKKYEKLADVLKSTARPPPRAAQK